MEKNIERKYQKLRNHLVEGNFLTGKFFLDILIQKHSQFGHYNLTGLYGKDYGVYFNSGLSTNQVVHVGYVEDIFLKGENVSHEYDYE